MHLCVLQAEADSVTDAIVRDIIGPPADYRPGIFETKSRMRYLTSLSFKGNHRRCKFHLNTLYCVADRSN